MYDGNNKIDLLEKLQARREEEAIIKEIQANGKAVGFSWYLYEGEYYQIYSNKIRYSRQRNIKIDTHHGWYILDIANMNAVLLYIDGFEKILSGVDIADIVIYPDRYFIFKSPDKKKTELWRHDAQLVVADNIYRLTEEFWCLCSNGIYYLSNLDGRSSIPVGRWPLLYDPNRNILFYRDEENKIPVDCSHLIDRLKYI